MRLTGSTLMVTPRDVVDAEACGHRALVALRRAHGLPVAGDTEAGAPGEAVRHAGEVHEEGVTTATSRRALEQGALVLDLTGKTPDLPAWETLAGRTVEALTGAGRDGAVGPVGLVLQGGVLQHREGLLLTGRPDYLVATDDGWRVEDAKLARTPGPGAVLQTMLYREALAAALAGTGARVHEEVRLHLGDGSHRDVPARTAAAWSRTRLVALADLLADLRGRGALRPEHREVPRWCSTCHDDSPCGVARSGADHLGAVALLRADQAGHLRAAGITTMAALATSVGVVPGLAAPVLAGLREQAQLQVLARESGTVPHRVREHPARLGPREAMPGLWAVPDPDPGDVFFDIEGDPLWVSPGSRSDAGLEYLLGATHDGDAFTAFWAHDRAQEARSFRAFVDWVEERRERFPAMRVLHYAPYEPAALVRLAARHDARADVVDAWLREGVLVDLYAAVRRGLRVGVASYSIKKVEALYGRSHSLDAADQAAGGGVESAMGSVDAYEAWRSTGEAALLEGIERYNRLDCDSTRDLRDHLLALRAGAVAAGELSVPTVEAGAPEPQDGDLSATALLRTDLEAAAAALLGDAEVGEVCEDPALEPRRVLAALLGYHVREEKAVWQDAFRAAGDVAVEGPAAAVDDPAVLGGLVFVDGEAGARGGFSWIFRAPVQEHRAEPGGALACVHGAPLPVSLAALEEGDGGEVGLRAVVTMSGPKAAAGGWGAATPPAVEALLPYAGISHEPLQRSLLDLAERVGPAGSGQGWRSPGGARAADRALLAGVPHLDGPLAPALPGEDPVAHAVRLVGERDGLVLAVQGPPGTGKSRLGTVVVDALLADAAARGRQVRIGVTANSHAVVQHLLGAIHAATPGAVVRHKSSKAKKGKDPATWERLCADGCDNPVLATGNAAGWASGEVLGGTAWAFSPEHGPDLDVLVVDEAGQMGLGDVLAAARGARSVLLLGDPQQLAKPSRGQHPPGAAVSALEHLMGEAATMPPAQGLFLGTTWRMHADVASFVSDVSYEGRLLPAPITAGRAVLPLGQAPGGGAPDPLSGTGLRWVPVQHTGSAQRSPEECAVVVELVRALLERRWTSEAGTAPITPTDVLVVSPYNVQVRALRAALDAADLEAVPVGTVDRFQGQQGVAVVYSTASSDAMSAPRGMGFLYDLHRLNVAVSRARCLAFWVGSPALLAPAVTTLADVALADAHCSFVERAVRVDPADLRARP